MESCGIHDVLIHTIASFMNQPISAATKKIAISIQRAMSGRCLNTNFMLKAAYGKAITAVPGKSEGWLMCPFEDDMPIYFGGSDDAPAAYVEVNVFGRSVPGSAWEKLTKSIMAALNSELGIPEDRTYIRYTATTDWGWNGGNF